MNNCTKCRVRNNSEFQTQKFQISCTRAAIRKTTVSSLQSALVFISNQTSSRILRIIIHSDELITTLQVFSFSVLSWNQIRQTDLRQKHNLSFDTNKSQHIIYKHVRKMTYHIMRETEAFAEEYEAEFEMEISEKHLHLNWEMSFLIENRRSIVYHCRPFKVT